MRPVLGTTFFTLCQVFVDRLFDQFVRVRLLFFDLLSLLLVPERGSFYCLKSTMLGPICKG